MSSFPSQHEQMHLNLSTVLVWVVLSYKTVPFVTLRLRLNQPDTFSFPAIAVTLWWADCGLDYCPFRLSLLSEDVEQRWYNRRGVCLSLLVSGHEENQKSDSRTSRFSGPPEVIQPPAWLDTQLCPIQTDWSHITDCGASRVHVSLKIRQYNSFSSVWVGC